MLEKLISAYRMSDKFCKLMLDYETRGITYQDAEKLPDYIELADQVQRMKQDHLKSMLGCSLLYWIIHPKKRVSAQKYYRSRFGKPGPPCPIEHKEG